MHAGIAGSNLAKNMDFFKISFVVFNGYLYLADMTSRDADLI
jgi:hypothetical protein